MRRAAVATSAVLLALTSTTGCGAAEDELPARTREAEVVAIAAEEVARVERTVGGTRDRVTVVVKEPFTQRPRTWYLSFGGPCLGYGGDDRAYVDSNGRDPRPLLE